MGTKWFTFRVLFQRGVYPADDFHMVKKYGQTVLVTQDLALENYLDKCAHISFNYRRISHHCRTQDFEASEP